MNEQENSAWQRAFDETCAPVLEGAAPSSIVEAGVGLIARGLFRMVGTDGPAATAASALAALDAIRHSWADLGLCRKPGA